jgi:hypothetical protein
MNQRLKLIAELNPIEFVSLLKTNLKREPGLHYNLVVGKKVALHFVLTQISPNFNGFNLKQLLCKVLSNKMFYSKNIAFNIFNNVLS